MCDMPVLFTCPRHAGGLRLTSAACASQWLRAHNVDRSHQLFPCRGCEIGASNAGEEPDRVPSRLDACCVRCGRIGLRLVRGNGLCISCYNREKEVSNGRDRHGNVPRGLPRTRDLRIIAHGDHLGLYSWKGVGLDEAWQMVPRTIGKAIIYAPLPQTVQLQLPHIPEALSRRLESLRCSS